MPTITRDYPAPGADLGSISLSVYPAGSIYEHEMPVLGHLNTVQAAAVWGVTVKTFYASVPELRILGIVSEAGRNVRVDTFKFITDWIHATPERCSRANVLKARDVRRRNGERLPPGRPKKSKPVGR